MIRRVLVGLTIVLAAALGARDAAAQVPVDLELVLAVDISRSIDAEEFRLQREGYAMAFRHPEVLDAIAGGIFGAIAVTYFEWSGATEQATIVEWTVVRDSEDGDGVAAAILVAPRHFYDGTSISGAIDYGVARFAASGAEGARRVIDVSGDGTNNRGRSVTAARDAALAAGLTINGLVILNEPGRGPPWPEPPLEEYFRDNVIGGPGAFVEVVTGFATFAEAIRKKLIREIAGDHTRQFAGLE